MPTIAPQKSCEEGNEVPWDLIDLGKALVAGEVACPCLHRERDNASDENGQYEQQVNGNELLSKRGEDGLTSGGGYLVEHDRIIEAEHRPDQ